MLKTGGNERGSWEKFAVSYFFNCFREKKISYFRENGKGIFVSTVHFGFLKPDRNVRFGQQISTNQK
jgi:hypothetical protein